MAGAELQDEVAFKIFLPSSPWFKSPEIAALAARFRKSLRLKFADAVIHATAQSFGRPLLTRNTKDFRAGTPGVKIPYTLMP